jgi:hypothetical protein
VSLGKKRVLVDSCARVSADARVCARVRVCVCARLLVRLCARACTARVSELCARACASRLHAPSHRTARTCRINRSARAARCGRARVVAVRCHCPGSRGLAAGVTWTSRTANAEWAARYGHTSVVDAAGAIYVIGGRGGPDLSYTYFQDVWVSTDGGARPDSV